MPNNNIVSDDDTEMNDIANGGDVNIFSGWLYILELDPSNEYKGRIVKKITKIKKKKRKKGEKMVLKEVHIKRSTNLCWNKMARWKKYHYNIYAPTQWTKKANPKGTGIEGRGGAHPELEKKVK